MRLRDCDGDIWEEDGEGGWEHNSDSLIDCGRSPDRETLELVWGPLSEVDE